MIEQVIYVVLSVLYYALYALIFIMMANAIMSWIPMGGEGKLRGFINEVSDLVVSPMRLFLDRFESVRRLPFDLSFFATFLALIIIVDIIGILRM